MVSLIVAVTIAWPKFTEVLNLRSDNVRLDEQAVNLENKAKELADFNKAELDQQLSAAEQLLPSKKEVFLVIAQIERTASANGILINKIDAAPGSVGLETATEVVTAPVSQLGQQAFDASVIPIKISLTGDYRSFLQFVRSLLSLSRVVGIGDLTLSASGESSQLRVGMTVNSYWQPLPSQLGSIESPVQELTQQEKDLLSDVQLEVFVPTPELPPVTTGKSDIFAPF